MEEFDRPRGILGESDREYLAGESEVEEKSQVERNIRARIRERVREGILDFRYLADSNHLEDRDLNQALYALDESEGTTTEPGSFFEDEDVSRNNVLKEDVKEGLIELVAFVFRVNPSQKHFERLVSQGVEQALSRIDEDAAIVDPVQIPIEDRDVIADRIETLIDEGIQLSDKEIRIALEQQIRPPTEIAEHIQEHGTSNSPVSVRKKQKSLRDLLYPDDSTYEERKHLIEEKLEEAIEKIDDDEHAEDF